jgi:hypothetical protein
VVAKAIKGVIGNSVDNVESRAKLADEAGRTMDQGVQAVKRVTDPMAEIAAASPERNSSMEQATQAIVPMNRATEQDAAIVEQATASADRVELRAHAPSGVVTAFAVADPAAESRPNLKVIQGTRASARRTLAEVTRIGDSTRWAPPLPPPRIVPVR